MPTREQLMQLILEYKAKEKFDDMTNTLTRIVFMGQSLSELECRLLVIAYRGAFLNRIEKLPDTMDENKISQILRECNEICSSFLTLVEQSVLPKLSGNVAMNAYLLAHAGSLYGELSQLCSEEDTPLYVRYASTKLQLAMNEADFHLGFVHEIRLGVAVIYAAFINNVLCQPREAVRFCRQIYRQAEHIQNTSAPGAMEVDCIRNIWLQCNTYLFEHLRRKLNSTLTQPTVKSRSQVSVTDGSRTTETNGVIRRRRNSCI